MTRIGLSVDIGKSLGEVQKESDSIDELVQDTSESLEVDYVKCIFCGRERSEHEMQKTFCRQHKGICKMCFRFDSEE